ncbi:MAG: hypothetical protein GX932_05265, partial [Methanomicrobiales archaeon]|nr:hypothetical protein [Methanomicrobiales archaeon]
MATAGEGIEDEVVLAAENVPAGTEDLAIEPGGCIPRVVEDAVPEFLLPPT